MKHLYNFILLVSITLGTGFAWGQNVTVTNTSAPAACDGSAYFQNWSFYNTAGGWTFSWYQDSTLIAGNDSLVTGLCAGNYSLVFDSLGVVVNTEYFSVGNPCSGLTVNFTVTNTTPGACVGAIATTVTGGSAPYTYTWSNGQTTQNGTNLCAGTYALTVTDMMGCVTTTNVSVYGDTLTFIQANLNLVDDSTGSCIGGGNCFPSGGTAPYNITWSNGQTGNYVSGLCDGVYTVTISDQTGDTLIETFIITDLSTTFGNTIYNDSIPVATLYGNLITNCTIDYSNIDSASLSQAVYDSVSQNLYVTWSVYDSSGNVTYIYDTLGLTGNPGVYVVNISVYCPFKTVPEYFKIYGDFYFNGSSTVLAVSSNALDEVSVYPNPFTTGICINNTHGKVNSFAIYDMHGRLLISNNHVSVGTVEISGLDHLSAGTYLLQMVATNGGQRIIKLIK